MPNKKENLRNHSLIFGIAQFLVFILIIYLIISALRPSEPSTIETSGSSEVSVMPDKAIVFLGTETESATASESQQSNANIMDEVRSSLYPFNDLKIETASYYVSPVYSYTEDVPKIIGYRTTHILKLTAMNINDTGKIIDSAFNSGATTVQSIQFALTDERQKEINQLLLSEAVADAKTRAKIIAKEAKVSLKKPLTISESSNYPLFRTMASSEMAKSTDISPQELQLSASVSVIWKIC